MAQNRETELEQVLANWIEQALSPTLELREGVDRASWVANNVLHWLQSEAAGNISDAEHATNSARHELMRLGGWEAFGEALHELTHIGDALGDLRVVLGLHHS